MNDDELELRLRNELHRRIQPPADAPVELWSRIDRSMRLEPVVPVAPTSLRDFHPTRRARVGAFGGLVAIAAVVALVAAGLMLRHPVQPAAPGSLPATVDMFSRIDANSAWAANGGELYVTRDDGATWAKGTLPGIGLAQMYASPQPEPTYTCTPDGSCSSTSSYQFPDRLYPDFVDADHGWLVSWTQSNPSNYTDSDFSLTVHRTSDGGRTWAATPVPGTFRGFGVVQFVDVSHGMLVVYDMGAASSSGSGQSSGPVDGGSAPLPSPTPAPKADGTTILMTSDGGATWTRKAALPGIALVSLASAGEAWALTGDPIAYSGDLHVRHTTDGAATWSDASIPSSSACGSFTNTDAMPVRRGDVVQLVLTCYAPSGQGMQVGSGDAVSTDPAQGMPVPADYSTQIVVFQSRDDGATWTVAGSQSVSGMPVNGGTFSYFLRAHTPQPVMLGLPDNVGSMMTMKASFDAGATWISCALEGLPGSPAMITWVSPDDVWVGIQKYDVSSPYSGSSMPRMQLYATKDRGKTWRALMGAPEWPASPEPTPTMGGWETPGPVPSGAIPVDPSAMPSSIGVTSASSGWAVIGQTVQTTDDGGSTWRKTSLPGATGQATIAVFDTRRFLGVGVDPSGHTSSSIQLVVTSTADGGESFSTATVPVPTATAAKSGFTLSAHYVSATVVHIWVTAWSDAKTECLRLDSMDTGATWSGPTTVSCTASQPNWQTALVGWSYDFASNPNSGEALPLAVTTDGGLTWVSSVVPSPNPGSAVKPYVAVIAPNADGTLSAAIQWYLLDETSGQATQVLETLMSVDGGQSWLPMNQSSGGVQITSPIVVLNSDIWLAGTMNAGELIQSRDHGATWAAQPAKGLTVIPQFMVFADEHVGWASGYVECSYNVNCAGATGIFLTTDGGLTWRQIY